MRAFVVVVVVAFGFVDVGCSVEVGPGQIAPLSFDVPIPLEGTPPPMSGDTQIDLVSQDTATALDNQYGSKLHAIEAIDLRVDQLQALDAEGRVLDGVTIAVRLETVTIDRVGERLRLPDDITQAAIGAIMAKQAVTVNVHFDLDWPATVTPTLVRGLVQPILIVNALRAL
jgi:hypothetical protein